MANVRYENFMLENKMKDLLETKLGVKSYMTLDNTLTQEAGMTKRVNTYVYNGSVEDVAEGEGNIDFGSASYTPVEYKVITTQGRFKYTDEDAMTDPFLIDTLMAGQSTEMIRDLNAKFFAELGKASVTVPYSGTFSYDAVVDGIQAMNLEDEAGLFLLVGVDLLAQLRKDKAITEAKLGEILFTGQVGFLAGVPVVLSRQVPADHAFLATREAITYFTKKEVSVAQERLENERENIVYIRKVGVMALTNDTKVVKIAPSAGAYNVVRK